jgi:hypothetical protein
MKESAPQPKRGYITTNKRGHKQPKSNHEREHVTKRESTPTNFTEEYTTTEERAQLTIKERAPNNHRESASRKERACGTPNLQRETGKHSHRKIRGAPT